MEYNAQNVKNLGKNLVTAPAPNQVRRIEYTVHGDALKEKIFYKDGIKRLNVYTVDDNKIQLTHTYTKGKPSKDTRLPENNDTPDLLKVLSNTSSYLDETLLNIITYNEKPDIIYPI